jgi:hypothetical protein
MQNAKLSQQINKHKVKLNTMAIQISGLDSGKMEERGKVKGQTFWEFFRC